MEPADGEPKLDIDRFRSVEMAITEVETAGNVYREVGQYGLVREDLTELTLFFMAALSRGQGLHDAIAREIRRTNPHAVFPLMRAYAETAMMVLYVKDHPAYVRALQDRPWG
jgi:hypothetical protein